MSAPTICICTLQLKDFLGVNYTTAELIAEPRKSFMENSNFILGSPQRVQPDVNGLCTLPLVETTSSEQTVVFRINYHTNNTFGTVVFDPLLIPNTATLDLSTVLTISRG